MRAFLHLLKTSPTHLGFGKLWLSSFGSGREGCVYYAARALVGRSACIWLSNQRCLHRLKFRGWEVSIAIAPRVVRRIQKSNTALVACCSDWLFKPFIDALFFDHGLISWVSVWLIIIEPLSIAQWIQENLRYRPIVTEGLGAILLRSLILSPPRQVWIGSYSCISLKPTCSETCSRCRQIRSQEWCTIAEPNLLSIPNYTRFPCLQSEDSASSCQDLAVESRSNLIQNRHLADPPSIDYCHLNSQDCSTIHQRR